MIGVAMLPSLCTAAHSMPQGGGVIYPAWSAEYWDNATLSGTPAYTRSEVRIRFDWEDWRPILGVKAESVKNFPKDNFSARWTGQIISRFNETYTFSLLSDEGARVKIKPSTGGTWTTLIDAWQPHSRRTDTADYTMSTGTVYDVVVEYYDLTGDAVCELSWSSPSTPHEVIDYVSASTHKDVRPYFYADLNLHAPEGTNRTAETGATAYDENGWPASDFSYTLQVGYSGGLSGRHLLSFRGTARVRLSGGVFVDTGTDTLTKGLGYNSTNNLTQAYVDFAQPAKPVITASDTQRSPSHPVGSGLTEVSLMKPRQNGGLVTHEPGEIICQAGLDAMLPFIMIRFQRNGLNNVVNWEDRTSPDYARIVGQHTRADTNWEKMILAANEMGRDPHFCFGGSISYEFMDKLAKLLRYGSDGVNPYNGPVADPVWPPLNPNLRVYLEHGNEMVWSAIQPSDWRHVDYPNIVATEQQPEWGAINFDGRAAGDTVRGLYRYHAYRTVRMSQAMRTVWGDAAMGDKARIFLFGFYEKDPQNSMCQYIDDYFNNGAGSFVADPRPVSHYLWGAGPAVYYSSVNIWGESGTTWISDRSFEETSLAAGTAVLRPTHPKWTFEGGSGIVDIRYPVHHAVASSTPAAAITSSSNLSAGFMFTVGSSDIYVTESGRTVLSGNSRNHSVGIYEVTGTTASGFPQAVAPSIATAGAGAGSAVLEPLRYTGWTSGDTQRVGLMRLQAGKRYMIISTESAGGDTYPGPTSVLNAGPGITIDGPVTVDKGSINGRETTLTTSLSFTPDPGKGYGNVQFRYITQILSPASGMQIVPPNPYIDSRITSGVFGKATIPSEVTNGTRMAFIAGTGAIKQDITITEAGDYALQFTGVCGHTGDNRLDITIGGSNVWNNLLMGTGRKPKYGVFQWGTEYLPLTPGTYTVRIATKNSDPAASVYIDGMHLLNMNSYFGGPGAANMLGAGTATSGSDGRYEVVCEHSTRMAQMWGLVACTYEGGTQPGGDWNGQNVLYPTQAKWFHPTSTTADNQAARVWNRYGAYNFSYYYEAFDQINIADAGNYRPWQAARDRAMGWELEPSSALPIDRPITSADPNYKGQPGSRWDLFSHPFLSKGFDTSPTLTPYQWKGWAVLVPNSGYYFVALDSTAGGTARLSINDATQVAAGTTGGTLSNRVWLTKGIHTVKVRAETGTFDIQEIRIEAAAAPADPYADWAASYGLSPGSLLDESPAGDGIRNLMKYALGIEPAVAGFQGHFSQDRMEDSGTNWFMVRYTRPEPAPTDVSYAVQAAGSLQAADWDAGVVVASAVSNGLRTITVRDPLPMSGNTNRFIRLRVTK